MKNKFLFPAIFAVVTIVSIIAISCNRDAEDISLSTPLPTALFTSALGGLSVSSTNNVDTVSIELTRPVPQNATVTFTVSSPTGAVEGKQYKVSSKTISFTAGNRKPDVASVLTFDPAYYDGPVTGRIDTLILSIDNVASTGIANVLPQEQKFIAKYSCSDLIGAVKITDPWYGTTFTGNSTLIAPDTLAISGMFGDPANVLKVYVNRATGVAIPSSAAIAPTLASYTNPRITKAMGNYDPCSSPKSLTFTNTTLTVDQGNFGSATLTITQE